MGKGLAERRVAVGGVVGGVRVGLVVGATAASAKNALAVTGREPGVQVDVKADVAEVP